MYGANGIISEKIFKKKKKHMCHGCSRCVISHFNVVLLR